MNAIRKKIYDALTHRCLMHLTHQTPFGDKSETVGLITSIISRDKIRVHRYDTKAHAFLYDDIGSKAQVSVAVKNIIDIKLLWVSFSEQEVANGHHFLHESNVKFGLSSYIFYQLKAKRRKHTEKTSIETFSPYKHNLVLSKNILAIEQAHTFIPVISVEMRYDVDKKSFIEGDVWIHKEQNLNHVLRHRFHQISATDLEKTKQQFKANTPFIETAFYFTQKRDYEDWKNTHLMHLEQTELTRPLKAFLGEMTPKNLGRKTYVLPSPYRADVPQRQLLMSMFKHPMTTLAYGYNYDFDKLVDNIRLTALLNNETVCIIDPLHQITTVGSGGIDLRTTEGIETAFEQLKQYETIEKVVIQDIKQIDYGRLDSDVFKQNNLYYQVKLLQSLADLYHRQGRFLDALRVYGVIERYITKLSTCDIRSLYQKDNDYVELNKHLHERSLKLKTPAYLQLRNIEKHREPKDMRYKLLRLIKKPVYFHQLKQIFPVIILSTTQHIPWIRKSFDCLVAINPKSHQISDLALSDKVTLIDQDVTHKTNAKNGQSNVPLFYDAAQYRLFDTVFAQDARIVKTYGAEGFYEAEPQYVHEVVATDIQGNSVGSEVDAIVRYAQSLSKNIAVRTPFTDQKRRLKKALKRYGITDVETIFKPTQKSLVILSLSIHEMTQQKTYDWMKSHPALQYFLDIPGLRVFGDLNHVKRLVSNNDTLYPFLISRMNKSKQPLGMNPVIYQVLERLSKLEGSFKAVKGVPLQTVFNGVDDLFKRVRVDLCVYDFRQEIVLIVIRIDMHLRKTWLNKIIQLCNKHHIELFVLPPQGARALKRLNALLDNFE